MRLRASVRFGEELEVLRLSRGYSYEDLAAKLGCIPRTIERWVRGERAPGPRQVGKIATLFDLKEPTLRGWLTRDDEPQFYNFSQAAVRLGGWTKLNDVIGHILDVEFPIPPGDGNFMGDPDKWLEIFKMSSTSGLVLIDRSGTVLGYWFCIAVTESLYEAAVRGENINASITTSDVILPVFPGVYDMYFVDFFPRPQFANAKIHRMLRESLFDYLVDLAEEGIFFRRIAAHLSTPEIMSICRNLGFQERCKHQTHTMYVAGRKEESTSMYELVLDPDNGAQFFARSPELLKLYDAGGAWEQ